jgi:hypothetical protein
MSIKIIKTIIRKILIFHIGMINKINNKNKNNNKNNNKMLNLIKNLIKVIGILV